MVVPPRLRPAFSYVGYPQEYYGLPLESHFPEGGSLQPGSLRGGAEFQNADQA